MIAADPPGWPQLDLPWTTDVVVRGPRIFWGGPLDVEGLAVGSVSAAVTAANSFATSRGSSWRSWVASGLVGASFDSIGRLRRDGEPLVAWGELSGFFRTGDGWVRLHGNYPHHARRLLDVLGASDRAGVQSKLLELTSLDAETRIRAAGGIAAAVRTEREWREHEHHRTAIAHRPLIELGTPTGQARALGASNSLPLDGIRVLDLTRVIAGPTASRFLGALGADVLRVDGPDHPELLDQHLDTGFAKHSAELDFVDPGNLDTTRQLAGSADVVLSAYRPGALRRFGLDAGNLLTEYPHLVVVELSAWGASGPWEHERGFDSIVQAATGVATTYARPDGTPGALPVQALDHATGYLMATAAMRLLARRSTEGGATASLALARTANWLQDQPCSSITSDGDAFDGPDCPLWLDEAESSYGRLEHVRPPYFTGEVPASYPTTPSRYAADPPEWWLDQK
ncbi:CoA transferase [Rudaeicoccus suwonensis]|uniref:CoA transferase family III n=1 Tax=Rudaeicoccus suwonensis TaxID=657409 RepID=A0A561E9G2_9MICO|nr:CoA transferase [Rudaeicoccus suwonensis]TWE12253.1 CoA transferase family III [Rudaeicoccus suwonensis]